MVGVEELEPRVTPSNTPPVAVNDSYSLHQGQTLNVVAIEGVLDNDSDAENDPLTAESVSDTSHGYLSIISDGSFTYTPNSGFVGTDSFTYRADDGTDFSNIATVTITVTNTAPTAADDSYSVHQGQTLNILNTSSVLANDADADDDVLSSVQISTTSHGYLAFYGDGTFDYSPDAGYVGSDSFTYQAFDGAEYSVTKTVSISVTNLAPSAAGQSYDAQQDQALNISSAAGVLTDDSDFDGDSLTASLVSDTSHGYLSLISDGSFSYNPDTGYSGLDSFTYRVHDGAEYSDTVTVWISVAGDDTPQFTFSSASYIVSENGSSATITVALNRAYDQSLTVDYATSDGTATAGSDYTATGGTLTFAAGVTSQTFTVPITSDSTAEPDETVWLALANPGGGAELGDLDAATLNIVPGVPAVITVNSLNDGNNRDAVLTLHEAILLANGTLNPNALLPAEFVLLTGLPGANQTDEIHFDLPGIGPYAINLTQALPTITDAVVIDGGTQPGFTASPIIELNGANAGPGVNGLTITAGNSTIRSLVIREFDGDGIYITEGGNNRIKNNYIGTDVNGELDKGNRGDGIFISESPDNVIGGTEAGQGNLVSSNGFGVVLTGDLTARNVVAGNLIGTDDTGTKRLGNSQAGVKISGGAQNNIIGGVQGPGTNLIAANGTIGIWITGSGTNRNQVIGNWIGDKPGEEDLGNDGSGVKIDAGASNNEIGISTVAGTYNVIAGNGFDGVNISTPTTMQNKVRANFIGLYADGNTVDGNGRHGVYLQESADNVVGGSEVNGAARNVISSNGKNGVYIAGPTAVLNKVIGNYIGTNAAGLEDRGNTKDGVLIEGASNTIVGGATAEERNVISGNEENGIHLTAFTDELDVTTRALNTRITGNYIGTKATGTGDRGNTKAGIFVENGKNTFIGTAAASGRNVISGNDGDGIDVSESKYTVVRNNYIGLDKDGTGAIGNNLTGVSFYASTEIVIGEAGARNVISSNKDVGIRIESSTDAMIQANYIGLDKAGDVGRGNEKGGITITGTGTRRVLIGGLLDTERNVISDNRGAGADAQAGHGIAILGGTGTTVQGNYIGTDRTGLVALGNKGSGIYIQGNSPGNIIGGVAQGAKNVISANAGWGIDINSLGNKVIGNVIGRKADGVADEDFLNDAGGIRNPHGTGDDKNDVKDNTGQG